MSYTLEVGDKGATGITCHNCHKTSHNPNDIEKRYCGNCHVFHPRDIDTKFKYVGKKPVTLTRGDADYLLYWGAGKKGKVHWSVNGKNSLCMVVLGQKVAQNSQNVQVCVNCDNLKKRRIVR